LSISGCSSDTFVACLSFAFFEKTQNPFWTLNAATIGETIGGALTVFVGGGPARKDDGAPTH
jgi:hypothetical protein